MNKILLLITAFAIISCKNEAPIDYAIVKGKIINNSSDELRIYSLDDAEFEGVLKVAEDGSFVDTLKVSPGVFIFYAGRNQAKLFLNKGADLNISFDAKALDSTLTFSGVGAEGSNYFVEKSAKEQEFNKNRADFLKLSEADYKAKQLEFKTQLETILAANSELTTEFKTLEKRNLHYIYLHSLTSFERGHQYYAEEPEFKVSKEFLSELNGVSYENEEDFLYSEKYVYLVQGYYFKEADILMEADTNLSSGMAYLKAVATNNNEAIKDKLVNEASRNMIYQDDMKAYYNALITISTNEKDKEFYTKSYNDVKHLAAGQPSPKFINYENNAGGTTSLDDFLGKYVYIDVWATWCGPCKQQIPYLEKVAEQYHNKNIEFISISVDKDVDHDKWKAMIKEKNMKGIQLLADKQFNSEFIRKYFINAIPRFILLDPKGNIIECSTHTPENKKLIDLFNSFNI